MLCQYEYNISNGQKIVSNIYNNNKASNAKIGQNVNPQHLISSTKMRSPKSLHNLQHDEGGNYMAEAEDKN
jgi:hypothetical protein